MMEHARNVIGLPILYMSAKAMYNRFVKCDDQRAAVEAGNMLDWLPSYMVLDATFLAMMDSTSWTYRGTVLLHHAVVLAACFAVPHRELTNKIADARMVLFSGYEFSAQILMFQHYADILRLPGRHLVALVTFAIFVASRLLLPVSMLCDGLNSDSPVAFFNYGLKKSAVELRLVNTVEGLLLALNTFWCYKAYQKLSRYTSDASSNYNTVV